MLWWDRKFLSLAEKAGANIAMYKRYVDDTNIILKGIEPGVKWIEDSETLGIMQEEINRDREENTDVRTAREIRKMANTIAEAIQWEEAVPSTSPGGKLPILDLQCWTKELPQENTIVYYEFYRKPMANRLLMLHQSAMPDKIKRTTLSQEVIRILRNCHPDLSWQQKLTHLNRLTERMRDSGYPERFREEVIRSGLTGYQHMVEVEKAGGRPVNRLRKTNKNERKKEKERKKDNWYKNDLYSTVLFVPCTPGSILAKQLQQVESHDSEDRGWRVKIVEMGGQTIRSQTCKSNPWADRQCGKEKCLPCRSEKGGNCRKKNVGYKITCNTCNSEYHGETSRTMYCRGEEHLKALNARSKESVLWDHCKSQHEGQMVSFTMKATGYFREALTRQIDEAVRIFHTSNAMNRKGEWRKTAVPKATYAKE